MIGKKSKNKSKKESVDICCNCNKNSYTGCGGCAYFLGFIGSAVYYISTSTTFWTGFLGFLKALVWPAFLVYEVLKFLGM